MRNFLKHNALAIFVCLFAMGIYASATTYTRPYGSGDYAGGTKAVGTKVNAEFAALAAWLNGANISSDNIATQGVATANLADLAVTTAKIAANAVTKAKLEAANLKITGTSSLYSLSSNVVPALVTNLSTTITTSGRPVRISLQPNTDTYLSSGAATWGSFIQAILGGTGSAHLFFMRDLSTTGYFVLKSGLAASGPELPCSGFSYVDTAVTGSAGTYTYSTYVSMTPASQTVYVINCRMVAEEL